MSLVWINLHHLEAGGSILIDEAAMIQWPLAPRVTGINVLIASSDCVFTSLPRHVIMMLMVVSRSWDGECDACDATIRSSDTIIRVTLESWRLASLWPHVMSCYHWIPHHIHCYFQHSGRSDLRIWPWYHSDHSSIFTTHPTIPAAEHAECEAV